MADKYSIKMVLEESPAESTAYRLAKLDLRKYPHKARKVIKGDIDNDQFYYTNSVHLAYDTKIDYFERTEKQSKFHPMIEAGAIVHVWLGEHEPHPEALMSFIKKAFIKTDCAQIAFSPEFTVCNDCRKTNRGLLESCPSCSSQNVYGVTRIVGYFTKTTAWNKGKMGELSQRQRSSIN